VTPPSTQTSVADDESYTDVEYDEHGNAHVVSGKDATASTGASQGAAKKKIDTTADIALYENAFRDQRDRSERSWAQKGLKEADEKILTEENIKRNELAGDQSLPLDFLSHFPVVLPKTARETQQWKRYAPQHVIALESKNVKEKAEKEAKRRSSASRRQRLKWCAPSENIRMSKNVNTRGRIWCFLSISLDRSVSQLS